MVNRPKAKGTSAESLVVQYLCANGWPWAERRALAGAADMGDVSGCPGLVWEVKYAGSKIRMAEWVSETIVEQRNANADHGILVVKPPRLGAKKIDNWLAVMSSPGFQKLRAQVVLECPDSRPIIQEDEPASYNNQVVSQLAQFSTTTPEKCIPVLIRRPPGTGDKPDSWYRIMWLKDIVVLLRAAGYGTQLPAPGDDVSEAEASV